LAKIDVETDLWTSGADEKGHQDTTIVDPIGQPLRAAE
jgi:hypothetical protein